MSSNDVKTLVQKHLDAEARRDAPAAASFYSPDGEYFMASLGVHFKGREAVAAQYANSYVAFPDIEASVEGESAERSSYAHWGRLTGTLSGPLLGIQPTGKKMDVPYVSLYDVANGQILRETVHFDLEEFCTQLGLDIAAVRATARTMSAALAGATA